MVAHSGAVVARGVVVMMGEVIAAAAAVNGGLPVSYTHLRAHET